MKERIIELWNSEKLRDFVEDNRDMIIKVAAAALLVVAAFFVFIFVNGSEEEALAEEKIVTSETEAAGPIIMVDIGGEVNEPKVVELEEGSRVEDAIVAAGGVTDEADLTNINRAAFLNDGDKILIPSSESDGNTSTAYETETGSTGSGKININTADSEELQTLDGVGPVTAEKIIDYREENGQFSSIEDIKNVSGIGDKTFEKLKDDITTTF